MRYSLIVCLLLTGCGQGYYPREVCLERDLKSGQCLRAKFMCTEPMELRADGTLTPVCIMPTKAELKVQQERSKGE